jgi:hypothetical protein
VWKKLWLRFNKNLLLLPLFVTKERMGGKISFCVTLCRKVEAASRRELTRIENIFRLFARGEDQGLVFGLPCFAPLVSL